MFEQVVIMKRDFSSLSLSKLLSFLAGKFYISFALNLEFLHFAFATVTNCFDVLVIFFYGIILAYCCTVCSVEL